MARFLPPLRRSARPAVAVALFPPFVAAPLLVRSPLPTLVPTEWLQSTLAEHLDPTGIDRKVLVQLLPRVPQLRVPLPWIYDLVLISGSW